MMKKLFLSAFLLMPTLIFAQDWSTAGNTGAAGQWLGTNNAFPWVVKTNNTERFSISPTGAYKFNGLSGTGNGVMQVSSDGTVSRLNYSGLPGQVLTGSGTFSALSTLIGWTRASGTVTTNDKVGIGVTGALTKSLEVQGDAIFSGSVYATNFVLSDVTLVQGHLSFSTNMFFNGYDPSAGTRNEVYTNNEPFYIQSKYLYNNNTIINHNNGGKVAIGTDNPLAKFHVVGSARFDGVARMDSIQLGDSVIMKAGGGHLGVGPAIGGGTLHYYLPTCINKGTAKAFHTVKGFYSGWSDGGSVNMGHNGTHALIQSVGEGDAGVLKLNYFCGKDVAICTGTSGGNVAMTTATTGKVGIGTNTPEDKVQIKTGTFSISMGNALFPDLFYGTSYIGLNATRTSSNTWKTESDGAHNGGAVLYSNVMGDVFISTIPHTGTTGQTGIADSTVRKNTSLFINAANGNIGMGTTCTPYALTVEGHVGSREMWVKTDSWCDFVFDEDYKLPSIEEQESFIQQNGHLMHIPSEAKIVEQGGISLGEMSKAQMQTLEEMMLYLVETNKKLEQTNARLEQLEKENAELKKAINK